MFFLRKQNQNKPSFKLQYNFNNHAPVTIYKSTLHQQVTSQHIPASGQTGKLV